MQTISFSLDKQEHDCHSVRDGDVITFICPECGPIVEFRQGKMVRLRKSQYNHSGVSLPFGMNLNPPQEA